jgi:hypothetical protein
MFNRATIERKLSLFNLRRKLRRLDQPEGSFFMIVMPGGFHIAKLAIDYFPADRNLVVIGNGVDKAEAKWAQQNLPVARVLRTRPMFRHHDVLNAIFDSWDSNFGIVDYDCFVLEKGLVERLCAIEGGSLMNAAFFRDNEDPRLRVPETFLLFFNVDLMRALMKKYGVNTRIIRWHMLSPQVQGRLAAIGISEARLPETHKPYFDTLRLLMMLGLSDGLPYRFAAEIPASPAPSDQAFHVGGVSDPRSIGGIWALRGSYLWRKVLEASDDVFLRAHYESRFGRQNATELLDANHPLAREITPEFFDFCDRLLEGTARLGEADYSPRPQEKPVLAPGPLASGAQVRPPPNASR